jgi:hypothetical protein
MEVLVTEGIRGWFIGRVEDDWFEQPPTVEYDRDEILVIGEIAEPAMEGDVEEHDRIAARLSRIDGFRKKTRNDRIRIARGAEATFGRKVSWGVTCGDQTQLFTTLASPTMTRLRMPERQTLDTLVGAGVARSRSEALAWCVQQVGKHQSEWLGELEDAIEKVDEIRRRGPG